MTRRLVGLAFLLTAVLLCTLIARRVAPADGGLMPAGLLVLTLTALAVRRVSVPPSHRAG